MDTFKIKKYEVCFKFGEYENGNLAIMLMCKDGIPYGKLTINPGEKVDYPLVVIKNYSEGEGNDIWLKENGFCEFTGKTIEMGFVKVPIMICTEKLTKMIQEKKPD